mmetsp:Transcript_64109/g.177150  ORF Transcript_64109/g.177150 Transcript_64109/m.177150 type:complete len:342 (-) Transcript_64109:313-1338(-)
MCIMWFWDAVVFRTHSSAYALVLVCMILQSAGVRGVVGAFQKKKRQETSENRTRQAAQYPPPPKTAADVFGTTEASEDNPLLQYFGGILRKGQEAIFQNPEHDEDDNNHHTLTSFRSFGEWTPNEPVKPRYEEYAREEANDAPLEVPGVLYSLTVGVVAGSIMVPMSFSDTSGTGGVVFLPSMAFGMFLTSTLAVVYTVVISDSDLAPDLHLRRAFLPGLGAGALWTLAAFCSIYAIQYMSYVACIIVLISALFINSFCGIVWNRELEGKALRKFLIATGLLLATAMFLFFESSGILPFQTNGPGVSSGDGKSPPLPEYLYSYSYSYLFDDMDAPPPPGPP